MAGGDKSEKPTPQRLKKAREQGQFLSSRGMVGAVSFIVMLVMLQNLLPEWQHHFVTALTTLLDRSINRDISEGEWSTIFRSLFIESLMPVLMAGGIVWAATTGIHLAVSGGGFSMGRLMPKFDRINPMGKLKELPMQNLKSLIEAVVLIALLAFSVKSYANDYADRFLKLSFQSISRASAEIGTALDEVMWKAASLFVVFGVIDLARQYRKHMSGLKMTKEEIKQEHKSNEGDPHIKARIRRMRRDLLRRQMMKEVPKATAVVVNPTHYAVALKYDLDEMSSPMCVAKGKNWIAQKIRQIAIGNEVPIIENPPLARALHDALEVGQAIPPEFYKAVAEILAYIYKLTGRKLPG